MTDSQLAQEASAAERQFWFAEQVARKAAANIALGQIRIEGPVEVPALARALDAVVRAHEALHTAFVLDGQRLVREVVAPMPGRTPVLLAAGTAFDDVAARLDETGFDVQAGVLHWSAVAPDEDGASLYIAVHHIAFDGLSHEILTSDLADAYAQALTGTEPYLPPRPRAAVTSLGAAQRDELAAHWRTTLTGVADLPCTGAELSQRELARASLFEHRTTCSAGLAQKLRDRAREGAKTPYALLLTAYGRALAELTGAGEDFCVGTPIATRGTDQEREVGCLLNTVPIRMRGLDGPDAADRVWDAVVDAVLHLELPCEHIVAHCRTGRSRRMPLFQALFAYQSWTRTVHEAGPARLWTVPVKPVGAQAEVQMQVCEVEGDAFDVVVQTPAGGPWDGRLADLVAAFDNHLARLATAPTS
ncbi:condensation domain-containing protein [Streptomyces noursei]|uniref:condensation domain-containing protein n=1 Tax=Streptomyces noursei TaxID=1971 RepID=UPI00332C9BEE